MYESFYKLTTKPFRLSPDPHFFYPSAGHKRALSYLLYGLNQGEGFVVITGAPGTGKTTLAHKLLAQIDTQSVLVAHLTSTQIEAEDMLRLVAASFKLRSENVSKAGLLKDIESYLLARSRERKRCLLVVDEAQNLPPRSIEELRMLSNFQVGSKALLQIFLLGQEQFRTMLNSANFEQLRQRIIADYHLQPLDADETRRYIEARLQVAHWQNDPQFDPGAFAAIFEHTRGLPRRINMFCDRLLLYGFLESLHVLTRDAVNAVIQELSIDSVNRHEKVVFTPVENGDRRAASTGAIPIARHPFTAPKDTAPSPKVAPSAEIVAASPPAERARLVTPITPPVATERTAPPAAAAPAPTTPEPRDPTSVFAPKLARESRGESLAQPLRIDQTGTTARPALEYPSAPSVAPSLAVAESRWLFVLGGAIFVLLILAAWFYPPLRDVFETSPWVESAPTMPRTDIGGAEPPTLPGSASAEAGMSDPHGVDTVAPSAESMQSNHREGTEAAIGTDPAGISTPAGPNATMQVAPTPAGIGLPSDREVLPPVTTAATPETLPTKAMTEATVSSAPELTESRSSRGKPGSTAPAAAAAPAQPSIASRENSAPVAKITERELTLLLRKFSRAYEKGDLAAFIALFDRDVSTEDYNTVEAVRHDYADLFRKTAARQISFGDIRWEITGDVSYGNGPFEVRVRATPDSEYRVAKGTLRLRTRKKGSSVVITALYHNSN